MKPKSAVAAKIAMRLAQGAVASAEHKHYQSPEFRKKMRKKMREKAENCTPCAAMDYVDKTFAGLGEI